IESIHARIDGRPVPVTVPVGRQMRGTLKLRLPADETFVLSLGAKTKLSTTNWVDVNLRQELPVKIAARATRPALYALVVGVGQYRNPALTLRTDFPGRDADAIVPLLEAQKGPVFSSVEVFRSRTKHASLRNQEAKAQDIKDGLWWLKQKAESS